VRFGRYTQPPFNARIMGDTNNYGITWPINWLIGNASHPYVLFLEKDFQLVESADCAVQQIAIGVEMLKVCRASVYRSEAPLGWCCAPAPAVHSTEQSCAPRITALPAQWHAPVFVCLRQANKAQVIRYRSRHNAGRPNWARITYSGKEETIFKRQPNLLCNAFHWITNPEKRWPDKFWACNGVRWAPPLPPTAPRSPASPAVGARLGRSVHRSPVPPLPAAAIAAIAAAVGEGGGWVGAWRGLVGWLTAPRDVVMCEVFLLGPP
jgi:hypothetical protein